jgi:hypothetical protein
MQNLEKVVFMQKNIMPIMESTEEFDFTQFSFEELVFFIKDMLITKKIWDRRLFSCGEEFIGREYLENKIDLVAKEMIKRIKGQWSKSKIYESMNKGLRLPSEVVNFPEISQDLLVSRIFLKDDAINAIEKDGKEEIYISVKNKKYRMTNDSGIIVE